MSYAWEPMLVAANGLARVESDLWVHRSASATVSYPDEHHQALEDLQADSFWYFHRSRVLKTLLAKFSPDGLLDVGASNGYLTLAIGEVVPVAMLEPSAAGAKHGLALGLSPVIQTSFQDAEFNPNSVPHVGFFDVLEHIPDEQAFLQQVFECLQPGGLAFISVPAYAWLWSSFDEKVGHQRRYTLSSLQAATQSVGFVTLQRSYLFSILPLPVWVFRKLSAFLGKKPKPRQNHFSNKTTLGRLLSWLLKFEERWIGRGWTIPIGSSCICVVQKPNINE